jgi:pyroglutamyl-peptidase
MPRTILAIGYNPYPNVRDYNPTGVLARALNNHRVAGARVHGIQIPVAVQDAGPVLRRSLDRVKPDAALALGVAPGRLVISIERVALNALDFSVPDNRGRRYRDRSIRLSGPAAHFSTLPVRKILAALRKEGISAGLSNTAGTRLCNFAMYTLLDDFAAHGWDGPVGFMHVPHVSSAGMDKPRQVSIECVTIRRGILVALREIEAAMTRPPRRRSGAQS